MRASTEQITFEEMGHEGARTAGEKAERVSPSWHEKATEVLERFISMRVGSFTAENFREWAASSTKLDDPTLSGADPRCWGNVIQGAANRGLIEHAGYAKSTNPRAHGRPVAIWRRRSR